MMKPPPLFKIAKCPSCPNKASDVCGLSCATSCAALTPALCPVGSTITYKPKDPTYAATVYREAKIQSYTNHDAFIIGIDVYSRVVVIIDTATGKEWDITEEPRNAIEPEPMEHVLNDRRSAVVHPRHYGGDTVYEVIKVLGAWGLGFNLGNCVKYIARAGKKGGPADGADTTKALEDLRKARFYLDYEIKILEDGAPFKTIEEKYADLIDHTKP